MVEQKIFLPAGSNSRWKYAYQLWVSWAIFSQMKMHIYLSISYRERHNYSLTPICKNLSAYRGRQDNCSLCFFFFFSLIWSQWLRYFPRGFLAGSVVRNLPANAGDASLILDPGRSHMLRSSWAHESHSYWTCAREPGSYRYWAGELQLLKPGCPRAQAP